VVTGAIYRGRFSGLSLVVLADPSSTDDLFAGRALSGEAGQRFQVFLRAAGLTTRYLILRTLPVDTSDLRPTRRDALVDRAEVQAVHRAILDKLSATNAGLAALLAVGRGARRMAPSVAPPGLPIIDLKAWGEQGATASWNAALGRLASLDYATDLANPSFHYDGTRGQIPRHDLPYGTPRWIGTSGDRGSRPLDLTTGKPSPDYLKLYLPTWTAQLPVHPLTPAERAAADQL
jgi:hypothetical protein